MPRETHIKRIFGKRKASTPGGEPVDAPDIYADMQRIDRMMVMEHPGAQEVVRSTKWKDKPDDPPGGNPTREMMTIRLIDPEDPNPDDPSAWIDLPVIRRMTTMRHPGAQETITSFHPASAAVEPDSTARRVSVKRVTFAETNADATLDDTSYYADGSTYQRKADTVDTSQYLDVEVIESYPSTRHPGAQGVTVTMNNNLIKEMFADTPAGAPRGPVRLDPLQNLLNVCWGGGATEFEPAALIHRNPVTTANSSRLTISMWCRVQTTNAPSPPGNVYPLFCFGDSSIALVTNSTTPKQAGIMVELFGETDSIDGNDICTTDNLEQSAGGWLQYRPGVDPLPNSAGGNPWWGITNDGAPGNKFSPKIRASTLGDMDSKVVPDKWFHLMIAVDTSASLSYGSPYHKVAVSVNAAAYRDLAGPSDGVHNPTYENGNCPSTLYGGIGASSFFFGPFVATSASVGGTTNGIIPGYVFDLSGKELGLPTYSDSVWGLNNQIVQMAAVQVWVDQFIDPAEHIDKFVKIDPDDPTKPLLVDPKVAQAAFGKPTFFFDGPPSKFVNNRGSGGEFTKTGELKNFRPAPPRAPQET